MRHILRRKGAQVGAPDLPRWIDEVEAAGVGDGVLAVAARRATGLADGVLAELGAEGGGHGGQC